jgi:hypothetical protein
MDKTNFWWIGASPTPALVLFTEFPLWRPVQLGIIRNASIVLRIIRNRTRRWLKFRSLYVQCTRSLADMKFGFTCYMLWNSPLSSSLTLNYILFVNEGRCSSDSIGSRLRVDRDLIPIWARIFFSSPCPTLALGPTQWVPGALFPGLGVLINTHPHLVPRLRMRGAISPLPQYVFMSWYFLKHTDNLTFTIVNVNAT